MRRSVGLLVLAAALTACGSDGTSDGSSGAAATDQAAADQTADVETQPDNDTAAAGTFDGGTAMLTLDGVDYEFDIEFCVRSSLGMSGFGQTSADEKLTFSYEVVDLNDEDAELDNSIQFEPADGNADWRAGSVTGALPFNWGSVLFTLVENTIEGTGGFVNVFDPESTVVDGAFSITCE